MKKSKLRINYIFNLVYQIFLLITPLITAPYISRVLTSDGVGQYSFSLSIVTYFTIFATFGFTFYGQRSIAQHQSDKSERSKVFWEIFSLKVITSLISLIVLLVLIKSNILQDYNTLLSIQTINVISVALDATFLLQGEEEFKSIVVPNILIRICSIIAIFVFVKDTNDLKLYVLIQSIFLLLTSTVTLIFSRKFVSFVKVKNINIARHIIPAFKLFIPTVAISIYAILDKTLIGLISNDSQVGFYEQADKIAKMTLTIVTSLSAVMIPNNAKLFAEKNYEKLNKNIETAFSFSLFIGLPLMFGLIAIASNLVPWFFGPGYEECIRLIQILSVLTVAIGLNNVLGIQYLVPINKEKIFTISVFIGAISNFVLNVITIRYWGAVGAAISTIIAETLILVYQMIYLRKTFNFVKIFAKCVKIVVSSLIMFVIVYALSTILNSSIINTIILILVGGLVYLLSLLILREKLLLNLINTIQDNKVVIKMKSLMKRVLRKLVSKTNTYYKLIEIRRQKENGCLEGNVLKNILQFKVLDFKTYKNYKKVNYIALENSNFYYHIDKKVAIRTRKNENILDNIAINHSIFLENSIQELCVKYPKNKFVKLLQQENLRIRKFLNENQLKLFDDFYKNKCSSLESALQRILFVNQICWQTGHKLVGLGRLDKVLDQVFTNDINNQIVTIEQVEKMLKEFFILLNKDYKFKSNVILGDIGQIVILGGLDKEGNYFNSKLTEIILKTLTSLNIPDPKTLLRVSSKMPDQLLSLAIECISKGTGSPLLSNDDVIIKSMKEFGYDIEDASDYCTAACWEVVPQENASEINNYLNLNYIKVLNNTIQNKEYNNLDELLHDLKFNIAAELENIINKYKSTHYAYDPLMAFLKNDDKNLNTIKAKYNNLGILTVGISNAVNAIINIERYVFNEKKYSINQMFEKMNDDNFVNLLKNQNLKFGNDNKEVVDLTNKLMTMATNYLIEYNSLSDIKVKIGYSSPSYLVEGKLTGSSLDGRQKCESFNVHISTSKPLSYTELINFACQLNYSQPCINGNVIDFSTTPQIINEQREKFESLIKTAIEMGFYQMQINVVSYKQLIEAKNNPKLFPNLIVRVWGFSSYFNDLSDEYKDLLIERAKMYESIN